ncbi:AAA family ATPase [Mycobacterium sp. PDNC021]|uniref:bifunctional aminoglycoside phosphotransferase/ATP-binding protein n=1 Tax=Mycobacterium sp. PDNC021 TaxID=3391399 RepID=UPI003AB02EBF
MSLAVTPHVTDTVAPAARIEVHETHTGLVVLAGDRAYKAKKPVVTDFLDFSTRERRERACLREIELNRRLAADSYLGLAHLVAPAGGPGEPVIEMRRYPDAERLATMVAKGLPVEGHLDAIAKQLARLHAVSPHNEEISAAGRRTAVLARWEQNLAELDRRATALDAVGSIALISRLFQQYISGRSELFRQRVKQHRIVDGHGDLQAGDIFCTVDGPVVLDCLEFDDQLRYVDGIDDAAFLAMDLQFRGAAELADYFLTSYRQAADDAAPPSLPHFYCAYRATVRAKVDCIRMEQGDVVARPDALRHLELAIRNLRTATVRLILVGGAPGTGKSTVSRELATAVAAQVISSDDVRAELCEAGCLSGPAGQYGTGRYSPEQVELVYREMLNRAGLLLAQGCSVILDATWRDADLRQHSRALAHDHGCPLVELECSAPLGIAQERIRHRRGSTSEVTAEIAAALAKEPFSWPEAHRLDTADSLSATVDAAVAVCRSAL